MEKLIGPDAMVAIYLTSTELVGDIALKHYAKTDNKLFLGIGTSAYLGLVYILQYYLKKQSLGLVNGYWDAFSNIATTTAAFCMGERFTSKQIAGLSLIAGGMFLL